MFSFTISVLTNCPGYSIEGNIQCHIVQSYSTTDGYVQSCRKFCQAPVLVGCVNDCREFCQTPVLARCVSDFQKVLSDTSSCWVCESLSEFSSWHVNEEIIKPILKRAKPDRDTKHYVSVLLLYKNLILFWRIFISIFNFY